MILQGDSKMISKMKKLTFGLVIVIFSMGMLFAQHNHGMQKENSVKRQKTEMPKELPSGLTKMKYEEHKKSNSDSSKIDNKHMDMKGHDANMDSSITKKESIVREGVVDLAAIDKNNDGKVFQDMMDRNVISDLAGNCAVCEMKLKEVPLEEAKTNLVKNGFKVKE